MSTVITPILDEDGKLKKFLAVRREITGQKETEEKLRASEHRFRQLLENMNRLAVGLDLDGRITFCNETILHLTGWKQEQIQGKDWFELFIPENKRDEVSRAFLEGRSNDSVPEFQESEIMTREGDRKLISWINTIYRDHQGNIVGTTSVGEDITSQRKWEKEMLDLRKQSDRQREKMIAFISHELRSPLMSMKAGIDMLKMDLEEKGHRDTDFDERISALNDQITRMDSMSRELLNSSLYRRTDLEFDFKRTYLNKLVREICQRIQPELDSRKNISLIVEPCTTDIVGIWDKFRLDQAFTNIIENAIKYTKPAGGKIEVSISLKNDMAKVVINDHGIGIPKDHLERIFDMFSRAENVTRSKLTGFGIGLKITREIIEKHEGHIEVESALGLGSTFTVELPLQPSST